MLKDDHSQWCHTVSQGDKIAFREMFDYFYAALCIYARRFVEDTNTCEDLVQDVFCSVWMNRKNLNHSLSIRSYLLASVRNHCLNYLRNKSSQIHSNVNIEESPYYSEDMEGLLFLHELEELLAEALSKLPAEYRIAFEMSRIENKSADEIAIKLGVSVRTVERYRNKAVEILKKELKDYIPLLFVFLHIKI